MFPIWSVCLDLFNVLVFILNFHLRYRTGFYLHFCLGPLWRRPAPRWLAQASRLNRQRLRLRTGLPVLPLPRPLALRLRHSRHLDKIVTLLIICFSRIFKTYVSTF